MGRKKLNAKEREVARKRREDAQREKEQYLVKLKEEKASCDAILDNLGLSLSTSSEKNDKAFISSAAQVQQSTQAVATDPDVSNEETNTVPSNVIDAGGNVKDEGQDDQMDKDDDQEDEEGEDPCNDNLDADEEEEEEDDDEELEEGTTLSRSGLSLTVSSPVREKSNASVDWASKADIAKEETPNQSEVRKQSACATTGVYKKPAQPPPPSVLPPPPDEDEIEQSSSSARLSTVKHRYQTSLLTKGKSWHGGTGQEEDKTGGTSTKQRKLMFQQSLKEKTAANKAASARRLEGIGENDIPLSPLPTDEYLKRATLQRKYPSERLPSSIKRGERGPALPVIDGEEGEVDSSTPMSTRERMKLLQKEQSTKKKAEYVVRPEERPAAIVRSASTSLVGEHKKQDKQDAVKSETLQELAQLRTRKMTKFIHAKFDTIAERNAAVKAAEEAIYAQLEARQEAGSIGSSHRKPMATPGSEDGSSIGSSKVAAASIDNVLSVVDKVYFERKKREEIEKKRQREYKEKHIHTHQYDSQSDIISPTATSASRARKTLIVPTQFRGAASVSEHALRRGAKGEIDDTSQHTETSSIKGRKKTRNKKSEEIKVAQKREAEMETELQSKRLQTSDDNAKGIVQKEASTDESLDETMQEAKATEIVEEESSPSTLEKEASGAIEERTEVIGSAMEVEEEAEYPTTTATSSPAGVRGDLSEEGGAVEGEDEEMSESPDVPFVPDLDEEEEEDEDINTQHLTSDRTPRSPHLDPVVSPSDKKVEGDHNKKVEEVSSKVISPHAAGESTAAEPSIDIVKAPSMNGSESNVGKMTTNSKVDHGSLKQISSEAVGGGQSATAVQPLEQTAQISAAKKTDIDSAQKSKVNGKSQNNNSIVEGNDKQQDEPVRVPKPQYVEPAVSFDHQSKGSTSSVTDRLKDVPSGFKGIPEPVNKETGYEYNSTCRDFPTKQEEPVRVPKPQYVEPAVSFDHQSKGSTSSVTDRLKDVPSGFKGIPEPVNKETGYEYNTTCKDFPTKLEEPVRVSKSQYVEPAVSFDHQSKDSTVSITDRLKDVPSGFKGMPDPINKDTGYEYDSTCKDFPKFDQVATKASQASQVKESTMQSINRDGTAPLNVRASLKEKDETIKAPPPKPVNADTGYKITKGLNSAEMTLEGPSASAMAAEVNEREATAMEQAAIERAKEMARIMVEGGDLWTANGTNSSGNSIGGLLGEIGDDDGRILQILQDFDDDVSALSLHTSRSAGGSTVNVSEQYPITPRTPVERRKWVIKDVPGAATGKDVRRGSAKEDGADSPFIDNKKKTHVADSKAKSWNMNEPDQWFTYWSDEHDREYFYNPRKDEVAWRVPIGEEHKLILGSPSQRSHASASYQDRAGFTMSRNVRPDGSIKGSPVRVPKRKVDKIAPQSAPVSKSGTKTEAMSTFTDRKQQTATIETGSILEQGAMTAQSTKRDMFNTLSEDGDEDNEKAAILPTTKQSIERGSNGGKNAPRSANKTLVFILFLVFAAVAAFGVFNFLGDEQTSSGGSQIDDKREHIAMAPSQVSVDGNDEAASKKGPLANLRNVFKKDDRGSGVDPDDSDIPDNIKVVSDIPVEKQRKTSSIKKSDNDKKKAQPQQSSTNNLKPLRSTIETKKVTSQEATVETNSRKTLKEPQKVVQQQRQPETGSTKNNADTSSRSDRRGSTSGSLDRNVALTQNNDEQLAISVNGNNLEQEEETSWWSLVGVGTGSSTGKEDAKGDVVPANDAVGLAKIDNGKEQETKKPAVPISDAVMLKDKKRPRYCYIPLAYLLSRQCRRFARVKPIADTMSPDFLAI